MLQKYKMIIYEYRHNFNDQLLNTKRNTPIRCSSYSYRDSYFQPNYLKVVDFLFNLMTPPSPSVISHNSSLLLLLTFPLPLPRPRFVELLTTSSPSGAPDPSKKMNQNVF